MSDKFERGVLLRYALDHDMVNLPYVREEMVMSKRKELLEKNPWTPWMGKDGYWHCYLPDQNKDRDRRAIKKSTKRDIENAIIEYWDSIENAPTVEDIFNSWASDKLEYGEISEATYWRYKKDFERYFLVNSDFGRMRIEDVTEDDIEYFIKHSISEQKLTQKNYSNMRILIYGIFKKAKKIVDFSITNVVGDIELSRKVFARNQKPDEEDVFSEDELPMIFEYLAKNPDIINLGIMLMFVTGVRVGELVTLKNTDISGNVIHISRTESNYYANGHRIYEVLDHPKTEAGVRDIVIPSDSVWILKAIRMNNPFGEWMFTGKNGDRLKSYAFQNGMRRMCNALNIERRSPHKIRKTYGSILLDNGVDQRFILTQMGHTDIAVTEAHYHKNRKSLEVKTRIVDSIEDLQIRQLDNFG